MSFSFTVRESTKAKALEEVTRKMSEVVRDFPAHARDAVVVLNTAKAVADTVEESPERDFCVSASGWLLWEHKDGVDVFVGASVTVSANAYVRE